MSFEQSFRRILRVGVALLVALGVTAAATAQRVCEHKVKAYVVALDQPLTLNRLGASIPGGMMFALARDVVQTDAQGNPTNKICYPVSNCTAGQVTLRYDKRPRPIVLRVNEGDCLEIVFKNLLTPPAGSTSGLSAAAEEAPAPAARRGLKELEDTEANRGQRKAAEEKGKTRLRDLLPPRLEATAAAEEQPQQGWPTSRAASIHVQGMPWATPPQDPTKLGQNDGSYVGKNVNSLAKPNETKVYTLFAEHEGTYVLYSTADDWTLAATGAADGGSLPQGLFGAVNIQPTESDIKPYGQKFRPEWYRSQVTQKDLCLASTDGVYDPANDTCSRKNPNALPVINYQARYPANYQDANRRNLPILNMLCTPEAVTAKACVANELVHTDLNAIITGPNAGAFPDVKPQPPALRAIYSLPDRLQPYREFTIIYHESFNVAQAFSSFYNGSGAVKSIGSAADNFGINYGMGGIASEILANRLGVGPMQNCTECKYEEFFLSAWAVGDPAMNVDKPADQCTSTPNQPCATIAKYPDDPSNVYPSYISDHVRFRVLHGGSDLHHVHHQHAHQWLHSPNTPDGDYTDSQSIGPGSSFTMEMVYNGSGNVNQTVGDSIFHCHFYAHFASGMWSMWRVLDTLQTGTLLGADGRPADRVNPFTNKPEYTRALPDGEIVKGTPIPAVVPVPTLPMPPLPAPVKLSGTGKYEVMLVEKPGGEGIWQSPYAAGDPGTKAYLNPGYPFMIPGIGGHRPPHPPMDFAYACSDSPNPCKPGDVSQCQSPSATCERLDGGLPRHLISTGSAAMPPLNNTDFSKILTASTAVLLDEGGSMVEKIAMKTHAQRLRPSCLPDGTCTGACSDNGAPCSSDTVPGRWQCANPRNSTCDANKPVTYVLNGLPPVAGAPYADPCIKFSRDGGPAPDSPLRRYRAADIQLDAIFNKAGWHYPQQRMISLWQDVANTLNGQRAPEPLFFRANSNDCIEYTLANLVPNVYELDDFQVRTPTDILGQHIHLVKFDVTSSDGAGNGFNYEDGTFAPNEVTERITSIKNTAGGGKLDCSNVPPDQCPANLEPKPIPFFGPGPGGTWIGAQATIQRWYADPLYNNNGACSNDPKLPCTLLDLSKCGDLKATCDVSAGFCSDNGNSCTASNRAACGATSAECIPFHDRTLRTVFTHDHFGPSTHQQAGLYAGLVIEPKGSGWLSNDDGTKFGGFDPASKGIFKASGRFDGGPTSWQAVIQTVKPEQSFREYLLELQDTTLTYQAFAMPGFKLQPDAPGWKEQFADSSACDHREPWEPCGFCSYNGVCVTQATGAVVSPTKTCTVPALGSGAADPCNQAGVQCQLRTGFLTACTPENFSQCDGQALCTDPTCPSASPINGPIKACNLMSGFPSLSWASSPVDSPVTFNSTLGLILYAEAITFFGGTNNFSFNYRNEPLYTRTSNPVTGAVLSGNAGDLAYAYSSDPSITRPSPRGSVCLNVLQQSTGKGCQANSDCGTGADALCQPAGFCSDNFALCTSGYLQLCRNPGTASCQMTGPYKTPDYVQAGDPFTPLLRTYAGDDVQLRVLTGAHLNPHNFTIQGLNWLLEPSFVDSGWRNSEVMGISEHFELISRMPPAFSGGNADFLYQPGAAAIEQAGGNWGLLRSYSTKQAKLHPLPQNTPPASAPPATPVCPKVQPAGTQVRKYDVVALTVAQALGPNKALVYNATNPNGIYQDSGALVFFHKDSLQCTNPNDLSTCKLPSGVPVEPLVLRAAAGDCIQVTLHNGLPSTPITGGVTSPQQAVPFGCAYKMSKATNCGTTGLPACCISSSSNVSTQVGLRPQLVAFDPAAGGGVNAGLDPIGSSTQGIQTAGTGQKVTYTWYAGNIDAKAANEAERYIPIEFGAANLLAPDVMNHYRHALIGGLVIEPFGSSWETAGTKVAGTTAVVKEKDGSQFREFVVFTQDDLAVNGIEAVNYKSEPLNSGINPVPVARFCSKAACDLYASTLQSLVEQDAECSLAQADTSTLWCATTSGTTTTCAQCSFKPVTPTFTACAGDSVRFRVLHPGGFNTAEVFELYGHNWSEAPYTTEYDHCQSPTTQTNLWASQKQGTTNQCANLAFTLDYLPVAKRHENLWDASLNTWQGSRMGHGPTNHIDVLIPQAGGPFRIPGDYLYRTYPAMHFHGGMWGYFRVNQCTPQKPDRALSNQLPESSR